MAPLAFRWRDGAMVPLRPQAAEKAYEEGKTYWLEELCERSWISHNHQFAWLQTAWENLPESLMSLYPTPEHLRKRALIDSGWYNEELIDAGSKAAALRVASYIKSQDEFAVAIVRGPLLFVRKAKSQSRRQMNKAEFQASKDAIIGVISEMIGVKPDELRGAA